MWVGAATPDGYGQFNGAKNQHWLAHRLVWSLLGGTLPEDLHHACPGGAVKLCVLPDHLKPLTKAEHTAHHNPLPDACSHGHPYTEENTYWRKGRNGLLSRQCRRCKADQQIRRMAKMDAQRLAGVRKADAERRRERNGWKKQPGSRY